MTRRAAPPAPATARRWSTSPRALTLALAVVAGVGPACDEKFQSFLRNASDRHVEREKKKETDADRDAIEAAAISPPVRAAIALVRTSDYDFVAVKSDGSRKRYSGFDFAAMLETKSRWLGRGLDELSAWLDQIGGRTFFGGRSYFVRLPDGRELNFRSWLEAEIAALPTALPATETP
ncbi:hypothetical protein [Nannocystis bainbridge]|uniref:Uncharacterized protein n=1 Tax=Nannocystis bainbridge TaxID=2995303 RepID=A0ABT5DNX1_9BACT|nr:hypothetical protein [Nannocystis bainbridge]MDC0715346.1 hypothetical protein [Nannocystis bainbridge]